MNENPVPTFCSVYGDEENFLKIIEDASNHHRSTNKGGEARYRIEQTFIKGHKTLIKDELDKKYTEYSVRLTKQELDKLITLPKMYLVRHAIDRLQKSEFADLDLVQKALDLYREAKYIHETIKHVERDEAPKQQSEKTITFAGNKKQESFISDIEDQSLQALNESKSEMLRTLRLVFSDSNDLEKANLISYKEDMSKHLSETLIKQVKRRTEDRTIKSFESPVVKCDPNKIYLSTSLRLTGGVSLSIRAKAILGKTIILENRQEVSSSFNSRTEDADDLAMERSRILRSLW